MISKSFVAIMGIAVATFAVPASAQRMDTKGFYAGGSIGQAKFGGFCSAVSGFSCDDKDTAFRIFGGYQFHPNIGVELGYANLGKGKFSGTQSGVSFSGEEKLTAWDLVAVGSWPLATGFSVFGKLGVYHGEAKANVTGSSGGFSAVGTGSASGSDLTLGLGAGYDFNRNLGARLEWQHYNGFSDADNVDVFSLGVVYRFR